MNTDAPQGPAALLVDRAHRGLQLDITVFLLNLLGMKIIMREFRDLVGRAAADDEVANQIKIQQLKNVEKIQKLCSDLRDGKSNNVDFFPTNEVQQQVHRTTERVELYPVVRHVI